MAEKSIVGNLFGLTPELYQVQQQQLLDAQQRAAGAMAAGPGTMLNPSLAPLYAEAAQQGQLIGRGVQGLLGTEDPQLQIVRDVTEMRKQFDVSTPEGLRDFSQALAGKGYTEFAIQASAKAADIDRTIAQAEKARQEKLPNIANLQLYRERLVQGGADPRLIAEVDAEIKGLAEKGTKIVMPGEQQGKELRTANVKQYVDLGERALSAGTTLQTVNDMNSLINKSFTGVGSNVKLNAAQVANALGINVTGTSESEQLDQLFAALTIGQAKNLKGALSDKDVRFLKEAVGSRGLTKETISAVANRIARDAQIDDLTYQKATEFKNSGGDLASFDFVKAKKESIADVNEKIAKRQRLDELRRKQGQGQP
jgi:hypothetical protein